MPPLYQCRSYAERSLTAPPSPGTCMGNWFGVRNGDRSCYPGIMVRIRPARLSDASTIADIQVETWRDTYAGLIPDRTLIGLSCRSHKESWQRILHDTRADNITRVAEGPDACVVGLPMPAARARRTCPMTGRSIRSMSCRITRVRVTVGVFSARCCWHSRLPAIAARWSGSWQRTRHASSTRPWAASSSRRARSRSTMSSSASVRMAGPTSPATLKCARGGADSRS